MSCTNGSSYLAGDIANDRKPAHLKNTPILLRLRVFCFVGGFEVADVLEAPSFPKDVAPGNAIDINDFA